MNMLREKLADTFLWAYVALPNGLLATYPGHGKLPTAYDARVREWYKAALREGGVVWRILVDASTKRLTATVSMPPGRRRQRRSIRPSGPELRCRGRLRAGV